MSLLNQLFNRGVFGTKCKTCLSLAISRIKLLQNKRDMQTKHMRKEIAQFLQAGQESIAQIRVEHVIREQNIWASYEILELFCEFILARVPIIESQRDCPTELREAIASIIFAAPRCSDVPDLLHIKNLFTAKYGKEFVAAVSELRPDSGVNRTIIEKLSVSAPSGDLKLKVLKEIAREYNLVWDSSNTEAELCKRHEDLLGGSKQITSETGHSIQNLTNQGSLNQSVDIKQESPKPHHQAPKPYNNNNNNNNNNNKTTSSLSANEIQPSVVHDILIPFLDVKRNETIRSPQSSSDILERARAAIATAERASAAARAAADLVSGFSFESKLKLTDASTS